MPSPTHQQCSLSEAASSLCVSPQTMWLSSPGECCQASSRASPSSSPCPPHTLPLSPGLQSPPRSPHPGQSPMQNSSPGLDACMHRRVISSRVAGDTGLEAQPQTERKAKEVVARSKIPHTCQVVEVFSSSGGPWSALFLAGPENSWACSSHHSLSSSSALDLQEGKG